jgi:hypothetical protein
MIKDGAFGWWLYGTATPCPKPVDYYDPGDRRAEPMHGSALYQRFDLIGHTYSPDAAIAWVRDGVWNG